MYPNQQCTKDLTVLEYTNQTLLDQSVVHNQDDKVSTMLYKDLSSNPAATAEYGKSGMLQNFKNFDIFNRLFRSSNPYLSIF